MSGDTGDTGDTYALGRRPALDGLRGLAVLLVVIGHTIDTDNSAGTVGVTLFFALSGFLITRLLIEEHACTGTISYRSFLARRARRLAPALVLFLAAATAVTILYGYPAPTIIAPALYVTNLVVASGTSLPITEHTWSLALEEQFYLLWPPLLAVALRLRRRPVLVLTAAIVAVTLWRAIATGMGWPYLRTAFGPDMRVDAILAGCLLAFLAHHLRRIPTAAAVGAGASLLALCAVTRLETEPALMPLATVCSALVVAAAASRTSRALSFRPLCLLGLISYGVYLWHKPIAAAQGGTTGLAMVLGLSVTIAALSWLSVETMFRAAPRSVADPSEPEPTALGPAGSVGRAGA